MCVIWEVLRYMNSVCFTVSHANTDLYKQGFFSLTFNSRFYTTHLHFSFADNFVLVSISLLILFAISMLFPWSADISTDHDHTCQSSRPPYGLCHLGCRAGAHHRRRVRVAPGVTSSLCCSTTAGEIPTITGHRPQINWNQLSILEPIHCYDTSTVTLSIYWSKVTDEPLPLSRLQQTCSHRRRQGRDSDSEVASPLSKQRLHRRVVWKACIYTVTSTPINMTSLSLVITFLCD